jgi:protein O-mannosyl-transferase
MVLISTGLVLLILAAFEPLRHNDFVSYDDIDYVTDNPQIQSGLTPQSIRWAFTTYFAANWHPLTWLSHMADIELFGLNPLGHHLHNLLLHTLSTVLLFWLLYQMTGKVWCSAFAAIVFGIHPLRVESVAWSAERKDVLCTLLFMLTLAAYLYHVKQGGIGRYLLVVLCFILGLMAKPMLVTLPIVLLLLDFWPLNRMPHSPGIREQCVYPRCSYRTLITEKIPLLIIAFISCVITYQAQQHGKSIATQEQFPVVFRVLNAGTSYIAYIGKIFWPQNLAVLYPFPETGFRVGSVAAAFAGIFAISGYAVFQCRQKPYLLTGWLWYVVTLIPVIGLVHVGSQRIADRYTYLPSIGILLMATWAAAEFSSAKAYRKIICSLLGGVIIAAMLIATRTQLTYWQNSITLYKHTLAITSDNCIIESNLGIALMHQNRLPESFEHLSRALAMHPNDFLPNANMASVLMLQKQPEQAMFYINKAVKISPKDPMILWQKGLVLEMQGKVTEAIQAYEESLKYNRNDADSWYHLGTVKNSKGLFDAAEEAFRQCLKINPNHVQAGVNLGSLLQTENRMEEAAGCYRMVLRNEPNDYVICFALASISANTGKLSESIGYYRDTLRFKPDHTPALNDLAWILAAAPDTQIRNPQEAMSLVRKACELTDFKNPSFLDTLAVAYAANNQFKEAIETAQKAIDLANAAGQTDLASRMKKRLQLYQASKPYYDPPLKQQHAEI